VNASAPSYYILPGRISKYKKRVRSYISPDCSIMATPSFNLESAKQDRGLPSIFAEEFGSTNFTFKQKMVPLGSKLVFLHGPSHQCLNKKGFLVPSCDTHGKYFILDEKRIKHYQNSQRSLCDTDLEMESRGCHQIFKSYHCEESKMLVFFFKEDITVGSIEVKDERLVSNSTQSVYDFPGYVG
jgi:hypothetical protein